MHAHIKSAVIIGLDAVQVDVEVDVLAGLPSFVVVGLGDTAVKESRERLTAALSNIGYTPPRRKTIVSMAPASVKKEGSMYDVPITLGYLIASAQIQVEERRLEGAWFVGEIGLDGTIRPVHGMLPIAMEARNAGVRELYIPYRNAAEARAVADRVAVYPVASLPELIAHVVSGEGKARLSSIPQNQDSHEYVEPDIDFADIKGQEQAKRALLIAASSSHNVLLIGSPGTGKTLLARALAGILPPLTQEESFVVTSLYSIAGLLNEHQGLIRQRPFRSPHHGASGAALVGGGTHPRPGEVSLAHHGVLFLDELPEFPQIILDQLRQPIEDGYVTISRAANTLRFPARALLVGAMNPCKCGYLGSTRKECQCAPHDILRYQHRISGPLLDRFDLHLLINDVPLRELLSGERSSPSSQEMAQMAVAARERQIARQGKTNAELKVKEIKRYCEIDSTTEKLLSIAEQKFYLSSRGIHRLLKVARTIADLAPEENIQSHHIAEALQYREQLKAALPEFV